MPLELRECELLDLMGQTVPNHRLYHLMELCIHIYAVWCSLEGGREGGREGERESEREREREKKREKHNNNLFKINFLRSIFFLYSKIGRGIHGRCGPWWSHMWHPSTVSYWGHGDPICDALTQYAMWEWWVWWRCVVWFINGDVRRIVGSPTWRWWVRFPLGDDVGSEGVSISSVSLVPIPWHTHTQTHTHTHTQTQRHTRTWTWTGSAVRVWDGENQADTSHQTHLAIQVFSLIRCSVL